MNEDTKTLSVSGIDEQVKKDFRIACMRNDMTVSDVIREFMRNYIEAETWRDRRGD